MSLLDRIQEANRHDLRGFVPLRIAGATVGFVRHAFAETLNEWPDVFQVQREQVRLARDLDHPDTLPVRRTEAVDGVCRTLHRRGVIRGWREERYGVATSFAAPPLLLLERAAIPFFGVTAYGVHMNGFVGGGDGMRMWVARRALTKPTGAGKLDQVVAGGQPHGIGLTENMIKECAEEAGIPPALAAAVRPVGAITYVLETPDGLRPDVIFNFDLELPADFLPVNQDGEVDAFYLWELERVTHTVAETQSFKFNCSLVVIDFLIRHGRVPAEHPDYAALARGLRVALPFGGGS